MPNPVEVIPFSDSTFTSLEVADFYLGIQQGVEAAGQKIFDDIWAGWRELKRLEECFADPGNFWVAQDSADRLVGCAGLRYQDAQPGLVGRFGVSDTCRRQGIGTQLMETVLDWAHSHDFEALELETSPEQHGMPIYKRLGFVSVGIASDGDDIMQLELK